MADTLGPVGAAPISTRTLSFALYGHMGVRLF